MTFYEILGITPRASTTEIERAFRTLARKVHPDLNSGDLRGAEARMKLLNEIRDTLTDPLRRAVYDAELLDEATSRARATPPPADVATEPTAPAQADADAPSRRSSMFSSASWAKRALLAAGVGTLSAAVFMAAHPHEDDTTPTPATVPAVVSTPPAPPPEPRARLVAPKRPSRTVVRIGTRADDVLRKLGAPDRIEPGRQSGDAVFHYGALRLEIKNGRVARGDAAE